MVTISILYPQTPGATFDIACYLHTHRPMSLARLRSHPDFIALSVERGMAAPASDIAPAYVAMCHYRFRTADDFVAAFTPHALELELQGDMPNYPTITPIAQFSAVELTDQGSAVPNPLRERRSPGMIGRKNAGRSPHAIMNASAATPGSEPSKNWP